MRSVQVLAACAWHAADSGCMTNATVEQVSLRIPSGAVCLGDRSAVERWWEDMVYDGPQHAHDPWNWGLQLYDSAFATHIEISDSIEAHLHRACDGTVSRVDLVVGVAPPQAQPRLDLPDSLRDWLLDVPGDPQLTPVITPNTVVTLRAPGDSAVLVDPAAFEHGWTSGHTAMVPLRWPAPDGVLDVRMVASATTRLRIEVRWRSADSK